MSIRIQKDEDFIKTSLVKETKRRQKQKKQTMMVMVANENKIPGRKETKLLKKMEDINRSSQGYATRVLLLFSWRRLLFWPKRKRSGKKKRKIGPK